MSSLDYWGPGGTPQPTGLLTRAQLATRQPGTKYQDYVNYVTRTRARRAAARQSQWNSALGPLAAVVPPPGYFQQQAKSLYPILGPEEIQRRTQTSISSQIDPILANLRASSQRETTAGLAQIQSYAQGAAASLGQIAPEVQKAYEEALGQQQNIDSGLSGLMGKAGKNAAGSVGQALGAAHQVAGGAVGSVSGMGAGAAAAEAGMGSASQSELVANQAAQMAYAAGLPGVATSQGQFDAGRFILNEQRSLADQIGGITSQIPGITQSLLQSYQDDNLESRKARAALIQGGWQSALTAAGTNLGLQMDQKRIDESLREANLTQSGENLRQRVGESNANYRARLSEQGANQRAAAGEQGAMARALIAANSRGVSPGTNPASPSNLRVLSNQLAGAALKMRTRQVPVGADLINPVSKTNPANLGSSASGLKVASPAANNTAYQMIFNSLYAQVGQTIDPKKNPGWYANQVAAIAQRAGYAKATPATVLAALGPAPKVAAKPPVTPKAAQARRDAALNKATVNQTPEQLRKTNAALQHGRKIENTARTTAQRLLKKGVTKDQAISQVSQFLTGQVDPALALVTARKIVGEVYPSTGKNPNPPAATPTGAPTHKGPIKATAAVRQKDGSYVVRLHDGTVWRVSKGRWTQAKV